MPGALWFRTVGDTRRYAAEWITAIRETVKAATGSDLSCRTDHVTVVPASPWGFLLLFVPLLVSTVFLALHVALFSKPPSAAPNNGPRPSRSSDGRSHERTVAHRAS